MWLIIVSDVGRTTRGSSRSLPPPGQNTGGDTDFKCHPSSVPATALLLLNTDHTCDSLATAVWEERPSTVFVQSIMCSSPCRCIWLKLEADRVSNATFGDQGKLRSKAFHMICFLLKERQRNEAWEVCILMSCLFKSLV